VPYWGDPTARLLIIGLAPGLKGANRTGRPFTGDYAGDLLYATLQKFGLATGDYAQSPDDGLTLRHTLIANAVACVPPENKPTPLEQKTCRQFLTRRLAEQQALCYLARGRIGADWRRTAFRQLSLLALQHEHGRADDGDVRGRGRAGGGVYQPAFLIASRKASSMRVCQPGPAAL